MVRRWVWSSAAGLLLALGVLLLFVPGRDTSKEVRRARDGAPGDPLDPVSLQGTAEAGPPSPVAGLEGAAAREAEEAERTLTGRVLRAETGVGVEGAWVHLLGAEEAELSAWKALSGPDGRYRIRLPAIRHARVFVLGGGWFSVGLAAAQKDGFDPFLLEPAALGNLEHDLLVEKAASVIGHVYDSDDTTVPDVEVALHVRLAWASPFQDTRLAFGLARALTVATERNGSYRFDALVPGCRYSLRARTPGRAVVETKRFEAEGGQERIADLRLMPARSLHLRVVSADSGGGLPDVKVGVVTRTLHGSTGAWLWETTDGDGRATLGPIPTGPLGTLGLRVQKQGWLHAEPPDLERHDPEADAHLTVRMEQGLPLGGRVLEPGDVPVAGAWLVATLTGTRRQSETQTNEAGEFAYPCLRPGVYTVGVRTSFGGDVLVEQTAKAGEEDVVIRLPRALDKPILIRVLGPDGESVPRFRYATARTNGSSGGGDGWGGPLEVTAANEAGPVWIEIQAVFEHDGTPLPYAPASLGPLAPNSGEHVLRLEEERTIAGRVVDRAGRGVPAVTLKAYPVDRGPARGRISGFHGSARTRADGAFEIGGLAGTRYRIFVEAGPGYAPPLRPLVEAGRKDVVIHLDGGVAADLELVDAEGRPVNGAWVVVEAKGLGSVVSGWTKAEGRVRLEGLAAGAIYDLRVEAPHDRYDLANFVHAGWTTAEGRVTAPTGGFVHGTVLDERGKPWKGVSVVALTGASNPPYGLSGKDGAFWVGHLPAGRVRLVAKSHGAYHRTSLPVEAEVGTKGVRIVLPRYSRLAVRFRDWPAGVPARQVGLADAASPEVTYVAFLDQELRAVFQGVVPERTYVLFETLHSGADAFVAYAAAVPGDAKSVEVAVRPAAAIEGVVTGPEEALLRVVRIDERGVRAQVSASADGRFRLDGLPAGEWTLVATARGAHQRYRGSARVRTGEGAAIELGPVREK